MNTIKLSISDDMADEKNIGVADVRLVIQVMWIDVKKQTVTFFSNPNLEDIQKTPAQNAQAITGVPGMFLGGQSQSWSRTDQSQAGTMTVGQSKDIEAEGKVYTVAVEKIYEVPSNMTNKRFADFQISWD